MTESAENYWNNRVVTRASRRKFLGNDTLISWLFNLRCGRDAFLKNQLKKLSKAGAFKSSSPTILDIGCGWGLSFARGVGGEFYGVDIDGFPKDIALSNGYKDVQSYNHSENGSLLIPFEDKKFDAAVMVNLNAHIEPDGFSDLLGTIASRLKGDAPIYIVAELDNDGLSYKTMRRISHSKTKRLISGMQHVNFVTEEKFDEVLREHGFVIKKKETIIGNLLPFRHYHAFFGGKKNSFFLRSPALLIDIFLSALDRCVTVCGGGQEGKRFLVGYWCQVSSSQSKNTSA